MKGDFYYNLKFVPVAAAVIYSVGFGLPLALKLLMKFMGVGFFASSYIEVICLLNEHRCLEYTVIRFQVS